jgi:hypothetical protein
MAEVPPIDDFMGSRDDLFAWTVMLHNIVNAELGKPQMPLETARELYIHSPFTTASKTTGTDRSLAWPKGALPQNIALATLILIIIFIGIFVVTRKRS